jgi:hypothetical protein
MRHILICVLLTLTLTQVRAVRAADVTFQPLASITNDRNANLQSLGVLVDAGQVVGLRFDTVNGRHPHVSDFSIDVMKSGAVLDGDANHENIVLRGSIDSTVGTADLVITYLSNGLLGKHRDCRASMVRDESGQWHLVNIYDHTRVDHLVVKTWRLGISRIEGICPR